VQQSQKRKKNELITATNFPVITKPVMETVPKTVNELPTITAKLASEVSNRVARSFILRPKIPIWAHFGVPWNGKCLYIL
jgi:hypothetical protein